MLRTGAPLFQGRVRLVNARRSAARVGKEARLATGIVKWFSDQKGYGFITPDEGEGDLFVHYSNIVGDGFRTLKDGQRVEYDPQPGRKGVEAKEVRPT